eukprot:15447301-Alexandrium_andersonii.AAC.1
MFADAAEPHDLTARLVRALPAGSAQLCPGRHSSVPAQPAPLASSINGRASPASACAIPIL